jgi:hypothetical protein
MRERKLALRKETLSDLSSDEMQVVVGAYSGSPCVRVTTYIQSWVTCVDTLTVATCQCPTGASCPCPTGSGAGC